MADGWDGTGSAPAAQSKPSCGQLNLEQEALQWVREQDIVLHSAKGPVPNLADWVAREPIRGSWSGHPVGCEIFVVLGQVLASDDVVATLINGKVTLVHRRLWPVLVRVADRFLGIDRHDGATCCIGHDA
jgi:hypothetical protein